MINIARLANISGWLGMILILSSTLPTVLGIALGYSKDVPPLSMILLIWVGLILYTFRSVIIKDKLYITANLIGLFLYSILLIYAV